MFFSVLLGLVSPYLARLVIDFALIGKDIYIFNTLLVIGITSFAFSVPIGFVQKYTGFYLRTKIGFALRATFYRHFQTLSLRFAQSRSTGEHLYRLGPDLEGVVGLIVDFIPSIVVFIFRFVLLLSVCFWLSWKLTLIILLVSPIIYLHTCYFTNIQYALGKRITETNQDISGRLQEAIAQISLIKIFGKERREQRRYLTDVITLIRLNIENVKIAMLQGESGRLINAALTGGITYFLGYQVIKGRLTIGQLTALTMYMYQLLSAIKAFGGMYKDLKMKFIVMDRVLQTLDAEVEVKEHAHASRVLNTGKPIKFEKVTFGYIEERPVLKDIDTGMGPGETIAVVGPSGAGKTTLSYLLLRLYDPWSGRVLFDETDIINFKIQSYRKRIGFSNHDPSLLQLSVRDNITFGNPDASEEEIITYAKIADAHEFIMKLPYEYHTMIGAGGYQLSQGQKQRISIARAVATHPAFLILDEAMSSLNSDCEQNIVRGLREIRPEMGLVIISHRLSAIRAADRIIVINNGIIEAEGPHDTLVSERGTYYTLFQDQLTSDAVIHLNPIRNSAG